MYSKPVKCITWIMKMFILVHIFSLNERSQTSLCLNVDVWICMKASLTPGTSEPALKCYRIYFLSLPRKAFSCIVSSPPGVYHIKTDGTVTGPYFIVSRYCNQMVILFDSEPCCFYSFHSRFLFSEFIFYPFSVRAQCLYYSEFNNYIVILRHTSYGDIFNEYTLLWIQCLPYLLCKRILLLKKGLATMIGYPGALLHW